MLARLFLPVWLAWLAAPARAELGAVLAALASADPAPHFEKRGGRELFFVDGRPFLALAAEIVWYHTSWGRYRETMGAFDFLYPAARRLGLNTVKVPVKWSQVELRKGAYDFSYPDHVRRLAEENGLKLILGWFGHYASGRAGNLYRNLDNEVWAPMDLIEDERTYPRAVDGDGIAHHNAASYDSGAIIEREAAAFRALMRHIHTTDRRHTVVMVQVENEISVFDGSAAGNPKLWRDHSPRSNELFAAGGYTDDLRYSADRLAGAWLRRVTEAGGREHPIPFFLDFLSGKLAPWMVGGAPGEDVATCLEKCPFVKFVAINLYEFGAPDAAKWRERMQEYRVGRNLVAISETNSDCGPVAPLLAFLAVGEYGAPLFSPWALNVSFPTWGEPYVVSGGELANGAAALRRAFTAIRKAMLPVAAYGATDRLKVFLAQHGEETRDVAGARVTAANGPGGQAMVLHPEEEEFLIVGWRSAIAIRSGLSRWPRLKQVRIEAGRWESAQWKPEPDGGFLGVAEQQDGVFRIRLFEQPTVVRLFVPRQDGRS